MPAELSSLGDLRVVTAQFGGDCHDISIESGRDGRLNDHHGLNGVREPAQSRGAVDSQISRRSLLLLSTAGLQMKSCSPAPHCEQAFEAGNRFSLATRASKLALPPLGTLSILFCDFI